MPMSACAEERSHVGVADVRDRVRHDEAGRDVESVVLPEPLGPSSVTNSRLPRRVKRV
jgi:hypothetical protein